MKKNIIWLIFALNIFFFGHTIGSRHVNELESQNHQLIQEQKYQLGYNLRIAEALHQTNVDLALSILVPQIDSTLLTIAENSASVSYTTNDLRLINDDLNLRKVNSWMDNYSYTNWNKAGSNLFVVH